MADRESAEHLLKDVVQIAARCDRLHIGFETFLLLDRIDAVEVGIVEVGPLDSPYLVIHLFPFVRRINADFKISERHRALPRFYGRVCRNDDVCGTCRCTACTTATACT